MRREDIRAFLDRRWDLVADEALAEEARFYAREGSAGCARVAEELAEYVRSIGPESPDDRAADFQRHLAWRALLDRIAQSGVPRL